MKLFKQIKDQVHDASGIDNPDDYFWYKENDIYYPIKGSVEVRVFQKATVEFKSFIQVKNAKELLTLLENDPELNNISHLDRYPVDETENVLATVIENEDGENLFSNERDLCTIADFHHNEPHYFDKETLNYLRDEVVPEYKDNELSESLFSLSNFDDVESDCYHEATKNVQQHFDRIRKEMNRVGASYMRIIS